MRKNGYNQCRKISTFKLLVAFVLGMSTMILAVAVFEYISKHQKFKLPGVGIISNTDTPHTADADKTNPEYGAAFENVDLMDTHGNEKISLQEEVKPFVGIEVMEIAGSGQSKKVLVTKVAKGSPADKAGLMRGDEIIGFDHRKIENIAKLQDILNEKKPEEKVKIELSRSEKRKSVYIKMGSLTTAGQSWNEENLVRVNSDDESLPLSDSNIWSRIFEWGISLFPWTEQLARKYGLESNEKGIIVEEVTPDSKASKSGLMAGDLIRAVNQQATPDMESFFDAIQNKGELLLDVERQGQPIYLVASEEEDKPLCKRLIEE